MAMALPAAAVVESLDRASLSEQAPLMAEDIKDSVDQVLIYFNSHGIRDLEVMAPGEMKVCLDEFVVSASVRLSISFVQSVQIVVPQYMRFT